MRSELPSASKVYICHLQGHIYPPPSQENDIFADFFSKSRLINLHSFIYTVNLDTTDHRIAELVPLPYFVISIRTENPSAIAPSIARTSPTQTKVILRGKEYKSSFTIYQHINQFITQEFSLANDSSSLYSSYLFDKIQVSPYHTLSLPLPIRSGCSSANKSFHWHIRDEQLSTTATAILPLTTLQETFFAYQEAITPHYDGPFTGFIDDLTRIFSYYRSSGHRLLQQTENKLEMSMQQLPPFILLEQSGSGSITLSDQDILTVILPAATQQQLMTDDAVDKSATLATTTEAGTIGTGVTASVYTLPARYLLLDWNKLQSLPLKLPSSNHAGAASDAAYGRAVSSLQEFDQLLREQPEQGHLQQQQTEQQSGKATSSIAILYLTDLDHLLAPLPSANNQPNNSSSGTTMAADAQAILPCMTWLATLQLYREQLMIQQQAGQAGLAGMTVIFLATTSQRKLWQTMTTTTTSNKQYVAASLEQMVDLILPIQSMQLSSVSAASAAAAEHSADDIVVNDDAEDEDDCLVVYEAIKRQYGTSSWLPQLLPTNSIGVATVVQQASSLPTVKVKAADQERATRSILQSPSSASNNKSSNSSSKPSNGSNFSQVYWEDIGGLDHVRREILEVLDLPYRHPELFPEQAPRRQGILLYGPPGTGKTLVAKAVATECQMHFISVKGPELLDSYVGESEKNIRQLFETARSPPPSASSSSSSASRGTILFFDEIDSLAPRRAMSSDAGGGVMDRLVSQLLTELDRVNSSHSSNSSDGSSQQHRVFIIAATNRPDLLDLALLRPGRFDRKIYLGVCRQPQEKRQIFLAQVRNFPVQRMTLQSPQLDEIVSALPEYVTGADISAVTNQAYQLALQRKLQDIVRQALQVGDKGGSTEGKDSGSYSLYEVLTSGSNQADEDYLIKIQSYLAKLEKEGEGDEEGLAIVVNQSDFLAACRMQGNVSSSVTPKELAYYESLQSQYAS